MHHISTSHTIMIFTNLHLCSIIVCLIHALDVLKYFNIWTLLKLPTIQPWQTDCNEFTHTQDKQRNQLHPSGSGKRFLETRMLDAKYPVAGGGLEIVECDGAANVQLTLAITNLNMADKGKCTRGQRCKKWMWWRVHWHGMKCVYRLNLRMLAYWGLWMMGGCGRIGTIESANAKSRNIF